MKKFSMIFMCCVLFPLVTKGSKSGLLVTADQTQKEIEESIVNFCMQHPNTTNDVAVVKPMFADCKQLKIALHSHSNFFSTAMPYTFDMSIFCAPAQVYTLNPGGELSRESVVRYYVVSDLVPTDKRGNILPGSSSDRGHGIYIRGDVQKAYEHLCCEAQARIGDDYLKKLSAYRVTSIIFSSIITPRDTALLQAAPTVKDELIAHCQAAQQRAAEYQTRRNQIVAALRTSLQGRNITGTSNDQSASKESA